MEINIGKYRITSEPTCVVVSRVSRRKKDDQEYLTDPTYWYNLENACRSLLTRMSYDALTDSNPDVVDVKSLRAAMLQAKDEIVSAVRDLAGAVTPADICPVANKEKREAA